MRQTANKKLEGARRKLEADVDAWLAKGNTVHEVQTHENRWYKDRGDVLRAPLTIVQSQVQHRWRSKRARSSQ